MRARVNKLLDVSTTVICFAPFVLYVYACVLKNGIKCYNNCSVND